MFTDPPYNVRIDGHATGKGRIRHREFRVASGEMHETAFIGFLQRALGVATQHCSSGAILYCCMDWRHSGQLETAAKLLGLAHLNTCIWVKDNPGMGSFYRSGHEFVLVFKVGKGRHRNNVELGRNGRNRTNVWQYPSVSSFGRRSDEGVLLALHPTVKPVAMVTDAILDCTVRGDMVLDPFLGVGSTLIAAQRTGRVCYGVEIDPLYVDATIRRWQNYSGEQARHALINQPFAAVEAERVLNG